MITIEKKFIAFEKQRKIALQRQEPVTYYNLCLKTGVYPEDEHLYEQGRAEVGHLWKNKKRK